MNQKLTFKIQSLYVSYSPDADVCFFGSCFEEAFNGLTDELRTRAMIAANAGSCERNADGQE